MIVSFDLDETLFVPDKGFKTEPALHFPMNVIYRERLRLGTVELMKYIREQNIQLWIYDNSDLPERYIRGLFLCYGIKLDQVVNAERHWKDVQANRTETMPSKYPSRYHIDLHVDDDLSIAQSGKVYGFRVFIVKGQDDEWTEKIKKEIEMIKKMRSDRQN